jgi:hypothetical protein
MSDDIQGNGAASSTDINNGTSDLKEMKKFERWRKSLQYITGLGMSETERTDFRRQVDHEASGWQCQQCETWRDSLMKNSTYRRRNHRSLPAPNLNNVHIHDSI